MNPSRPTLLLLIAAVLFLVLGPFLFALFLGTQPGMTIGLILTLLGAIGLWRGMQRMSRESGEP